MFQPAHFRETRPEVMYDLMRAQPFATLIAQATGQLTADHLPLALHADENRLRGHMGAANPLARTSDGPFEVLTVFQGPHAYVSPSWYPSKQDHGKVVPTWNYVTVHARGRMRVIRDTDWLRAHLATLTNRQEESRADPWAVTDAPEDFVTRQLRGMIGLEIDITDLQGTWKVSQNKTEADRQGVSAGMAAEGSDAGHMIAQIIEDRGRG